MRMSKTAFYPFVTWGFSWDPCGLIISLDANRDTVVNAKVDVQQHAGPFFSWDPCGLMISLDSGTSTVVNADVEGQQQAGPCLVEIHKTVYGKLTGQSKYE